MRFLRSNQIDTAGRPRKRARGFAIGIVLWAITIIAIMLVTVQVASYRQAASARESLARVRATWAARAGIESMIAKLQGQTRQTDSVSTVQILASMAAENTGEVVAQGLTTTWRIEHTDENGTLQPGVQDAHAKLNVNLLTQEDLLLLPDMTEELAQSIIDYIDADEDASVSGAEDETYQSLNHSYRARNTPIRDLAELDLVYNSRIEYVRGADADLNGIISAVERSGQNQSTSNSDGGWSAFMTAASSTSGLGAGGEPKLDLAAAQSADVTALLGVNTTQADAIVSSAQQTGFAMDAFIRTTLPNLANRAAQAQGQTLPANRRPTDLTREQLALLVDNCTIGDAKLTLPGKININTVSRRTLEYLASVDSTLADELIEYRESQGGEIVSIVDLLDLPGMTRAQLATLAAIFDTQSTVFVATCKGRDAATGLEVEMIAELDRSTMPLTIRSLRVR